MLPLQVGTRGTFCIELMKESFYQFKRNAIFPICFFSMCHIYGPFLNQIEVYSAGKVLFQLFQVVILSPGDP